MYFEAWTDGKISCRFRLFYLGHIMSKRLPFLLPKDKNGITVQKFLDAFEVVLMDMSGEPRYYGDSHPDGHFVIRRDATDGNGVEHITFYFGTAPDTLVSAFANRAALTYAEYHEVF